MKKLFVTNFTRRMNEEDLALIFARYGPVIRVTLRDGPKRRYALVTMPDKEADVAIEKLDGQEFDGMRIEVEESIY
jgi:RNA recognition motif-containing protein